MSEVNKYFTMIGNILPITSCGVSFFLCHLVGLSRLPTPNVLHGPIKSLAFRPLEEGTMETGNFMKRFFSPFFDSGFSKGSRTVTVPPSEPPADSLEARQIDLKQPESAAEGGVSDPREGDGDGKREGEAREVKHDSGADGEEVEGEKGNGDTSKIEQEGDGTRGVGWKSEFPVRPEAQDCAFYLKTGTCKFGSTCKFNHPIQRKPHEVVSICPVEAVFPTGFSCVSNCIG